MKSIIVSLFGLASFILLPACATYEAREPSTHTSRTTTTETAPTTSSSVQTRTTRTY